MRKNPRQVTRKLAKAGYIVAVFANPSAGQECVEGLNVENAEAKQLRIMRRERTQRMGAEFADHGHAATGKKTEVLKKFRAVRLQKG